MEALHTLVDFHLVCERFGARLAIDPRRKDQQISQPMDERVRIDILAPLALPIAVGILLGEDMLTDLSLDALSQIFAHVT